ncbi:TetR/AcrR family transcriptional regulator [Brevundimonas sp.]|uniref:TetR/AcrR family transcriptional regulator n=1 Tax=Brevundimonas sp. TaxID=1871086 RepID=UPI002FC876F7
MSAQQDPRVHTIIREARLRFVSDGYAAARIEPIARSAGVSTATLYTFFPSKVALFEAVVEAAAKEFYDRVGPFINASAPDRAMLTAYLTRYTEFLSDSFVRKMFRLIVAERPRFNTQAVDFFDRGRGDIAHTLIAMFATMGANGLVKIDKPGSAVSQLLGMVEHPVLLLPLASGKDPIQDRGAADIAEDAVETFWARYGI